MNASKSGGGIDERRHFRSGDRVEFSHEKKLLSGEVQTYRFQIVDGAEEQLLNVMTGDGFGIGNVKASACRLIGRAEPAQAEPETSRKPVDLVAIATKALSARGATLVAVGDLQALARHYLSLRTTLVNIAAADRSSPYREGERRAGDGASTPEAAARWCTPRELALACIEGRLPT